MTDDMIALGKRATACKGWRWMPGMRYTIWPGMTLRVPDTTPFAAPNGALPDLSDPATMGCLLALVREAWGICEVRTGIRWCVVVRPAGGGRRSIYGTTEAEALVAALEAAP